MRCPSRTVALSLLLAAGAARADIVLDGNFHIGDDDRADFTPVDPVDCDKARSYPMRFHLTETATILGFTLHDPIGLDNPTFTIDVDGSQQSALACPACDLCEGPTPCSDVTVSLVSPTVPLDPGYHTVAVVDPSGSSGNCNTGNDFGWSAMTLTSSATTSSISLVQRRHAGDNDDIDDDYDYTGSFSVGSTFYPDADEGVAITTTFTLTENLRLSQIDLIRLRDVNTTSGNHGTISVDGNLIGSIGSNGDPYPLNTGLLLASGSHTLTVSSGTLSGQRDDITWDGAVLQFSDAGSSGQLGFFNAVDLGANALTGSITTKLAGGAFTLDLYAMNGFGTGVNASYNGNATVDLMNSTTSSGILDVYGCDGSWAFVQTLGSVTFSAGQAQISGTFPTSGLKNARIRVTDSTTQAAGCSLDNFAIRPSSFTVAPSHDSETTPGIGAALTNTGTSGVPRHKAGQPFTIVATAIGATSVAATAYDGTPTVTRTVLAPATVAGELTVTSWGPASGGARRTDNAVYTEVGAVTITLQDTSWADADSDDSTAAQRTISGTANAGRFIPDHFTVTEGTLAPACPTGGFSYLGETLNWAAPGYGARLTAVNASGQVTQNYATSLGFESLPPTLASSPTYATNSVAIGEAPAATPAIGDAVAGVADLTLPALKFTRTRVAAFSAEIEITLPAFADADGVAPNESPNVVLGATTVGNGIGFTGGYKSQRFGRLYFEPAFGSERLPMGVPLRAEYFDGTTFVTNTADVCTLLAPTDVTLAPLGGQTIIAFAGSAPQWTVTLGAPNVTGQAGLSIDLVAPSAAVLYPYLAADTNGDDAYDDDPATTVTFGLYAGDNPRIYQREMIGN